MIDVHPIAGNMRKLGPRERTQEWLESSYMFRGHQAMQLCWGEHVIAMGLEIKKKLLLGL